MLPTERIPYSAITERPRLTLPAGARLAVWVIVNIEEWNEREVMPRTVLPRPRAPPLVPTSPIGRGMNTGIASASGVSSRCSMI